MGTDNKYERINITIPSKTLKLVDQVWQQSSLKSRSAFLDEAARWYAMRLQKAKLKRSLRAGYKEQAGRSLDALKEWEPASSEVVSGKAFSSDSDS